MRFGRVSLPLQFKKQFTIKVDATKQQMYWDIFQYSPLRYNGDSSDVDSYEKYVRGELQRFMASCQFRMVMPFSLVDRIHLHASTRDNNTGLLGFVLTSPIPPNAFAVRRIRTGVIAKV